LVPGRLVFGRLVSGRLVSGKLVFGRVRGKTPLQLPIYQFTNLPIYQSTNQPTPNPTNCSVGGSGGIFGRLPRPALTSSGLSGTVPRAYSSPSSPFPKFVFLIPQPAQFVNMPPPHSAFQFLGEPPRKENWVCRVVLPKATCQEVEMHPTLDIPDMSVIIVNENYLQQQGFCEAFRLLANGPLSSPRPLFSPHSGEKRGEEERVWGRWLRRPQTLSPPSPRRAAAAGHE